MIVQFGSKETCLKGDMAVNTHSYLPVLSGGHEVERTIQVLMFRITAHRRFEQATQKLIVQGLLKISVQVIGMNSIAASSPQGIGAPRR